MFCRNCGLKQGKGALFCRNCGEKIVIFNNDTKKLKNTPSFWLQYKSSLLIVILGLVVLVIMALGFLDSINESNQVSTMPASVLESNNVLLSPSQVEEEMLEFSQDDIIASVVNIYCPNIENEEFGGGSGTIITDDGLIITNSHIIPQDEENLFVGDEGCIVVLPDSITGQAKDMYLAHPIVLNQISDKYDLAFMEIYAPYSDDESQLYLSEYPRKFPMFNDTDRCKDEYIKLGEPVRIYGYPAISGGYSLTITDGIVSSFPGDGLLITSAKVSQGNSGGLAVDKRGCMIGIPAMVSYDAAESLGVIISSDLINSFIYEVKESIKDF